MKFEISLMNKGAVLLALTLMLILPVFAAMAGQQVETAPSAVYSQRSDKPVAQIYDKLYKSLEEARFYVVFEPNIGANLKRLSEKWGDEYNQSKLSEIRSMVFCNAWYANKVSNLDPNMLGFCPLHLTLIEREGKTTVLFNRPGVMAQDSPARELLVEIEAEVIAAIKLGMQ